MTPDEKHDNDVQDGEVFPSNNQTQSQVVPVSNQPRAHSMDHPPSYSGNEKKRFTLMETILQKNGVSLLANWGLFAGNVLPSKGNKLCQYRLKPTLQRHLAPYARRGIIGQNTVDLNSIRMGLR